MKPHCCDFKTSIVDANICHWWAIDETDDGYCSRPDWEERVCETQGRLNLGIIHLTPETLKPKPKTKNAKETKEEE